MNAIFFSYLKKLDSTIITLTDLVDSLPKMSQSILKNNLLDDFQLKSKIIFVVKISSDDFETCSFYHFYIIILEIYNE